MNKIDLTYKVLRHWEDNVVKASNNELHYDDYQDDKCAYCRSFHFCYNCPICHDTGEEGCDNTPYRDYVVEYENLSAVELEFLYLLNVAYSQGLEGKYMGEIH
jgi:hypothetical protein